MRESEEWGEVAEEDMAAPDTDIDKEDTGDWRLFLMDMGAIPPQPGYMQPVTHTSLEIQHLDVNLCLGDTFLFCSKVKTLKFKITAHKLNFTLF